MTANEPARRRLSATLWLTCLVSLHLGVVLVVDPGDTWTCLLILATYSPMLLLSWWLTFSQVRLSWRLAGYCLGMATIFVVFSRGYVCNPLRQIPWTRFDWIVFPSEGHVRAIQEAPVTLILFLGMVRLPRRWRLRLTTPFGTDSSNHAGGTWQCTLGDLLLLTFTLAATLGLLRWAAPYPAWILELPQLWLVSFSEAIPAVVDFLGALGRGLVALASAWLVLGTSRFRWRLLMIALVLFWPPAYTMLLIALAWITGLAFPRDSVLDLLSSEYCLTLLLFTAMTYSFVMVWFAGCRLHCGTSQMQGQE